MNSQEFTKYANEQIALARQYMPSNTQMALSIMEKLYVDIPAENHKHLEVECVKIILMCLSGSRNTSRKARLWVAKAEELLLDNITVQELAEMHLRLVPYYTMIADKKQAMEHYHAAFDSCEQERKVDVQLTGVQMFLETEEYKIAWEILFDVEQTLATQTAPLNNNEQIHLQQKAYCCALIARCSMIFGNILLAEEYIHAGLEFSKKSKNNYVTANLLGTLADIAMLQSNTSALIDIATELNSIALHSKLSIPLMQSLIILSIVHKIKTQYSQAILYAEQAYDIAQKYSDKLIRSNPALLLAELLLLENKNTSFAKKLLDEYKISVSGLNATNSLKKYWYVLGLWAEKENNLQLLATCLRETVNTESQDKLSLLRGEFHRAKACQNHSLLKNNSLANLHAPLTTQNNQMGDRAVMSNKFSAADVLHAVRSTVADIAIQMNYLNERTVQRKMQALSRILEENIREPELLKSIEQEIHSFHSEYLLQLSKAFPTLTHSELRIAVYLRLHLDTHQIAALLAISPYTVYTHRKNIRKKIGISRSNSLSSFLLTLQK